MNNKNLKIFIVFVLLTVSCLLYAEQAVKTSAKKYVSSAVTTDETARCLSCHTARQIKLVEAWEKTTHAANGVGCYECHAADPADPSAVPGHFGFSVKLPVTPKTCGSCHEEQYASFASSSHAFAFDTVKNLPSIKSSPIMFETTCASCHGNETNMKRGRAVDESWPNHGIGRINTDQSRGNCAACHGFHKDSLEKVRSADTCSQCHNVSFAPASEAWSSSRHGSGWEKSAKDADLNKSGFVPVCEPLMKPNCYVCHIAPTKEGQKATHNPSERLSWKLSSLKAVHTKEWGDKRLIMQETCRSCHASTQIEQYYRRFDAFVVETNNIIDEKMSSKNISIMDRIKMESTAIKARTGAAMMSPVIMLDAVGELNSH